MSYDLTKCIGYITDNTMKIISADFNRRLEQYGMTRIQWIALYYLGKNEKKLKQNELAALMKIKNSSAARLIDRMERDGLIHRVESIEDKRIKNLELSGKGYTMREQLLPEGEKFNNLLLEGITEDELKTFEIVLQKMLKNIYE
jgi:DNA-binding MarR family transcriptional regulator